MRRSWPKISLMCPIGQPLNKSVVATVWRNMCAGNRLGKADHLSKTPEPGYGRAKPHWSTAPTYHKERLTLIFAPGHVLFHPIERPRTEKEHPLFITLANDGSLPCLEIDGRALERQRFRYPRAGAEEYFNEHPEGEPVYVVGPRPLP